MFLGSCQPQKHSAEPELVPSCFIIPPLTAETSKQQEAKDDPKPEAEVYEDGEVQPGVVLKET